MSGRYHDEDPAVFPAASSQQPAIDQTRGRWIFDSSGEPVYLFDPRPEDVRLDVIAHALASINRYGGHAKRPYNVAEHSIHVAASVPPRLALRALLHDGHEAYIGDFVSPLKQEMSLNPHCVQPSIKVLAKAWDLAIYVRLGLPLEFDLSEEDQQIIHAADLAVGAAEMHAFGWPCTSPGRESAIAPVRIKFMGFDEAKTLWLRWFHYYSGNEAEYAKTLHSFVPEGGC